MMEILKIAAVENVNGEHCPGEPTSAIRFINISSVRAASLRASGLRAAASRRATNVQNVNKRAATEITTSVDYQRCSSSTVLMASSKNLSYASSQEPSEESQLNAIAMVDNLVELNVSLMWQKAESSKVAEQSCVKGPQNIKGLQSLARNADMKIQQDKMGIYDWIDSQPDEDGDVKEESLLSKAQQKQLEACKPTESNKIQKPGMMCDLAGANDTSNTLIMAKEASLRKQSSTKSTLVTAELQDAGVSYEDKREAEMIGIGVGTQIALEAIDMMRCDILMDNGSSPCVKKETFSLFDIGKDTQTALDAIDSMKYGIETDMVLSKGERREKSQRGSKLQQNFSGEAKKYTSEEDQQGKIKLPPLPITHGRKGELFSISPADCKPGGKKGSSKGTPKSMKELGARSLVMAEFQDAGVNYEDKEEAEMMGIGVNTQIALEAIDIIKCGILMDNGSSPCFEKETFSSFDIGSDTQTALDAIDIMRHGIETDMVLSKGERREKNEWGLKLQDFSGEAKKYTGEEDWQAKIKLPPLPITPSRKGELFSRSPAECKPGCKKGSSRGTLKTSKSQETALFKPPGPVSESNKRGLLLDFSSAMVPRRKRSRLCAPRGSLNENIKASGWQELDLHLHKSHKKAEKQTQADKAASVESEKSMLCPKQEGNNKEFVVLSESTNGAFLRRTKKGSLTKSDCYTLLEQSRKRRKCESRCMFVLFSHSLSEDTIKEQKKMLRKLGGHVASSAAKATHFVADSFARSRNMLEIMAAGKAVVTTMWLEGCSQAQYFVDEKSYILQDVQKEKDWSFCMHSSLAAARRKPLLKGMKVAVSPNTFPDFEAMKAIIESAGGQVLQKLSSSSQSKADESASVSFVIAGEKDYDVCVEFLRKGCKVYSTELILHGVVVQNLDFSRNCLFEDHLQ